MSDIAADIVKTTRDYVARELAPIEVRMSEIEASLARIPAGPQGSPGEPGMSGPPGKDADLHEVDALLVQVAKALERRFADA